MPMVDVNDEYCKPNYSGDEQGKVELAIGHLSNLNVNVNWEFVLISFLTGTKIIRAPRSLAKGSNNN